MIIRILINLFEEKICVLGTIIGSKTEAKIIPKVEKFHAQTPFVFMVCFRFDKK